MGLYLAVRCIAYGAWTWCDVLIVQFILDGLYTANLWCMLHQCWFKLQHCQISLLQILLQTNLNHQQPGLFPVHRCKAVIDSHGQRISCSHFVVEDGYIRNEQRRRAVNRCIVWDQSPFGIKVFSSNSISRSISLLFKESVSHMMWFGS